MFLVLINALLDARMKMRINLESTTKTRILRTIKLLLDFVTLARHPLRDSLGI